MKNEEKIRDQLQFLFEQAPIPYQSLDEEGHILYVNSPWLDALGYGLEEVVGRWFGSFLAPSVQEVFEKSFPCFKSENEVRGLELELVRKNGDHLFVSLNGRIERDDQGRFKQTHCVFQDITERRQMEKTLNQSKERYRLLSHTAGRLLASSDPQEIVNELCHQVMEHLDCQVFFNFLVDERAARLHLNAWAGISEEEAKRIEWLDYGVAVCECTALTGEPLVAEDISNSSDFRTELVRSYGIRAYACQPLTIQSKVIGTLSFGTKTRPSFSPWEIDLMKVVADQVATAMERMRLIEDLRRYRDELELRVEERTQQLRQANAMLKAQSVRLELMNSELQEFAFVASHDLHEPLRKIQAFSDRLRGKCETSLGEEGCDYLNRIQSAAHRMANLLDALLAYSRVTTRGQPFSRIDLSRAAEEALSDLEIAVEETAAQVEIGPLPTVEADPNQMRQLFQNLLGNALRYRRNGEKPMVRVHGYLEKGVGRVFVEDNSIGFEEKYLDLIFKPFQRLHGRTSPYKGTGMGLAICRKIAERHGGNITARSTPGAGSTFILTLPVKQETGTGDRAPSACFD